MSDNDDFWGEDSKPTQSKSYISSPKKEVPRRKPSIASTNSTESLKESPIKTVVESDDSEEIENKEPAASTDEEGSRSESGDEEEEEEARTEDDPLSDVWDSADEEEEPEFQNEEALNATLEQVKAMQGGHEIVTVKNGRGMYQEVDLTPPAALLEENELARKVYYRKKMPDECIKAGVKCLAYTRIIHGDNGAPWKLAWAEAWIAKAYWELKEYPAQTHYHAEEAVKHLSRLGRVKLAPEQLPPQKAELLEISLLTYYLLGKGLMALKKPEEAESALRKAETILNERKELGGMKESNFWRSEVFTALAKVKTLRQEPEEALRYLRKVEKLIERKYGRESSKVVAILQEMSKIEQSRGDEEGYENSVECSMKAYSITKSMYEDEAPEIAESAQLLALAYAKLEGEEAEIYAESYLNEAINCFQLAYGNAHAKPLKAQELLAKQIAAKGRPQEAALIYAETMNNYESAFGELSSRTAAAYRLLASFQLQAGQTAEGAKTLRKVVNLETQIYGKTHAKTRATQQALAVLLKNPKLDKKEARPRFQNAIRIAEAVGVFKSVLGD